MDFYSEHFESKKILIQILSTLFIMRIVGCICYSDIRDACFYEIYTSLHLVHMRLGALYLSNDSSVLRVLDPAADAEFLG